MRIGYINIDTKNSRDRVTIEGLKKNGAEIIEITDNSRGIKKFFRIWQKHKKIKTACDIIMVGYTGNILVPFARMISRKKIIYNALSSFYESMIISRAESKISLHSLWYFVVDICSFHSSHAILVESESQREFISRIFFIRKEKIFVHLTGVDDRDFYFDSQIKKLPHFTVLFRGKFLPEAGVSVLIQVAKHLEESDITIRIMGHGFLEKDIRKQIDELRPQNIELITEFLPTDELRQKMSECHLALGQLADHPRLLRTIPHKAFESLAMKLPYVTGRQPAILEILKENETCLCIRAGDDKDLAQKILYAKNNPLVIAKVAEKGYELYHKELSPEILGKKLYKFLRALLPQHSN